MPDHFHSDNQKTCKTEKLNTSVCYRKPGYYLENWFLELLFLIRQGWGRTDVVHCLYYRSQNNQKAEVGRPL